MVIYEAKHLLVDAMVKRIDPLLDLASGTACLTAIAERIGMTIIHPPTGVEFPHESVSSALRLSPETDLAFTQTSGYSAFVILAESHVSLHTFPEANFITFDCYSCVGFDHEKALQVLDTTFDLTEPNVQVVDRRFQLPSRAKALSTAGERMSSRIEQSLPRP